MKRVIKAVGTLSLVGCAVMNSQFAMADDSFWYGGFNVGQSKAKIDNARIAAQLQGAGLTVNSISNNKKDLGYKIFGGYQFNQHFALEAGYFNLGEFGYKANTTPTGTLTGNIKIQGINIDVLGIIPFTEKFSAFGRIGAQYAETKDHFSSTGFVPTPSNPNPSKNETNYKAGVGIQYNFTQSLGMRAEAERYRINDAVGKRGDIDLISLGLVYRFDQNKPAPVEKVATPEPVVMAPPPPPPPVVAPAPPPKVIVVMQPPPPPRKVVFSADTDADALFDFGKYVVKPNGQRALDKFVADLQGAKYEVITITGHADRIGSKAANMRLSERRAEAVKNYLIESAGIPADKISAKGVGSSEPMTKPGECKGKKATKKLVACLAPDRRVEAEVVATRTAK
jgi:OOP family OmpA-OmpF porin